MLQTSPGFGELRRYLLTTLQPVYRRLGLEEVAVVFIHSAIAVYQGSSIHTPYNAKYTIFGEGCY